MKLVPKNRPQISKAKCLSSRCKGLMSSRLQFLQKKIIGQKYAQVYSQECCEISPGGEHHQV